MSRRKGYEAYHARGVPAGGKGRDKKDRKMGVKAKLKKQEALCSDCGSKLVQTRYIIFPKSDGPIIPWCNQCQRYSGEASTLQERETSE